jgi:hypothetical protein
MTILAAESFTGSDDDILIAFLFSSAYCLVSSPHLFGLVDDVDGGRRGASVHITSTMSAIDPLIPRDCMLEIISVGGWDRQIRRPKRRRTNGTTS